jgi:hypothetical protein
MTTEAERIARDALAWDDHGSATWEAEIGPAALRAQENRDEG